MNLLKETTNNTYSINKNSNNLKVVCSTCKGIGLTIRNEQFICKHCVTNEKVLRCYLCENVRTGKYIECNECYGEGYILINNKYIDEKSESC